MTLVRDSALEWLKNDNEAKDATIESLTQDLIEMTLERDAALHLVQQLQAVRGEVD